MKKEIKKKVKLIVGIVLVIAILIVGYSIVSYIKGIKARNTVPLETELKNASNLTTQEIVITDAFEISKGKIPIITKNNFLVWYRTTVKASFDVNEAEIKETNTKVTVIIPHCTIDEDSVKIKSDDLKIYDTGFAILNVDQDDLIDVISEAETRAKKQAKSSADEFLKAADANAENVIHGLFDNIVDGREVVVEFK